MTVIEIIQKIDEIKPNTLSQEEKMRFLTTVDQTVKKQIIDNHVGGESVGFAPYTDGTSLDRELLVPSPFDDIYLYWVAAQIDYWNDEIEGYNNNMGMYTNAYNEFANDYRRTHMPIGNQIKFF